MRSEGRGEIGWEVEGVRHGPGEVEGGEVEWKGCREGHVFNLCFMLSGIPCPIPKGRENNSP